jgi:hypothetical protein
MWMRTVGTVTALVLGLAVAAPVSAHRTPASRAPAWAPAATAQIHPGTQMYTKGAQCTSNFVFRDRTGRVYVGYAAHCAGTGEATDTDGCKAASLPLGTPVTFNEGGNPNDAGTKVGSGRLVYSSWLTMQRLGEADSATCAYNDLALVRVRPADVAKVNPSVPFWGGPTGIDADGTATGDRVYTFGNSSLRAGLEPLAPHTGISLGDDPADGGWTHPLYTLAPGVPGDSGSAFLSADGKAVGVLSTLGLAPLPGSNNIGDLSRELGYARQHSGLRGLRLVPGTEPFHPLP